MDKFCYWKENLHELERKQPEAIGLSIYINLSNNTIIQFFLLLTTHSTVNKYFVVFGNCYTSGV